MSRTPYRVYEYQDERGRSDIREWRQRLRRSNPRASAKVDWLIDLLEAKGTALAFPYVRHIDGPIYELRAQGRNAVRIYYWQQERDVFIAAAGELKQRDNADRRLVEKALAAHAELHEE